MKVITNNQPRDIIDGWELSPDARGEFDYIDWPAVERGEASPQFFRFKGELHDLGEFSATGVFGETYPEVGQWDGYRSDSFFSALVVRYVEDYERVVVGLVLS